MSKERLEEANEWIRSMYDLLSLKTDENDRAYTQKRIDLFNWLIEQAEKVEELGKVVDKQSQVILGQNSGLDVMEQQNKRYREKVITAVEELEYVLYSNKSKGVKEFYVRNAIRFLNEALESETDD